MQSDIFPTGCHGTELTHVSTGDSVAMFGAGPVGPMAVHSAILRGAARVFALDEESDRPRLAADLGAAAVDFADADPADVIGEATGRQGVGCGVEAVGYQAHDPAGTGAPRDGPGQARRGGPLHGARIVSH
ncbi:zinc-binding dehydrogenase [Streptacidiphilus jiangxiensis]|uniref:Glutathione-independent formaldehyde dehydrogenase n=1 Tax=Streptacidiphilus jiangxiensis TaxID=235985 RepID=A0A1H7W925_STRJI|nr:zinc-binding dehydrogenase [Streptacidiphilus jiangxiensis]SEM18013.1 glutathione-independent formaldehyde dehydrogenase [Streptacidiphilus jiangxiensis]